MLEQHNPSDDSVMICSLTLTLLTYFIGDIESKLMNKPKPIWRLYLDLKEGVGMKIKRDVMLQPVQPRMTTGQKERRTPIFRYVGKRPN